MALPNESGADSRSRSFPIRGRVASHGETPASSGNIANIITVVRIFMVPLFLWLLLADDGEHGWMRYTSAVVFVVAIATDSLDGSLARRRNLITDLGKILDPIADKLLIGAALVALSMLGDLWWWVTIVILVRELGITLFRLAVVRKRVIPASRGGKTKTVMQSIAVTAYLLAPWTLLGDWVHWVTGGLMAVAVALTIISGIEYVVKAFTHGSAREESA